MQQNVLVAVVSSRFNANSQPEITLYSPLSVGVLLATLVYDLHPPLSPLTVCTLSLTCPSPARPLPPNSCLLEHSLPTTTWVGGRDQCVAMGQDGLAVITNEQFDNLKLYAEVLGRADDLYWLGYIYDSLGQLQDRFMNNLPGDSVLLMEGNFAATDGEGEVAAGQGVCVAIGGDKMLHRRSCRELHASLCQRVIEGR